MRRGIVVFIALAAMIFGVIAPAFAVAGGNVGDFEIDGDRADNPASTAIDWNTSPFPGELKPFTDLSKNKNDDSFGQGSKELQPSSWACTKGGVPKKDDIVEGAVAFRDVGTDRFLYARWKRVDVNGSADIDYEFNQSSLDVCPGVPQRTDGDIVITFDFDNGGGVNQVTIKALKWRFTGPGVGVFETAAVLEEHKTYDATVNGLTDPKTTDPGVPLGAFGELSLNLTKTIGDICPKFASAYMKTRSSTSITAELKDRTEKRSDICPPPQLGLTKSAQSSSVAVGGNVTFNINYSNAAPKGVAQTATVSDTLPAGTSFVSCTGPTGTSGDCTHPPVASGGTVTWQVGPLGPGTTGGVTLTVRVDSVPSGCRLCNTATIDSPQQPGSPDASATGCTYVSPAPPPGTGGASGNAVGIHISDTGLGINEDRASTSSSTATANPDSHTATVQSIALPSPPLPPSVLSTDVVQSVATSEVKATPAGAEQQSIAQTANLNILNGTVTAQLVRAVANTYAGPGGSSYNTNGTGFVNLYIDADGKLGPMAPVAYNNVNPGTTIDLTKLFGRNGNETSYVTLREVSGSTSGAYVGDLSVTMIHLHAVDRDPVSLGNQTTDVAVSRAVAHSAYPAATGCPGGVSGNALIASETTDPTILPVTVGYVSIPVYGGHDSQHLDLVALPSDGSVVSAAASDSDSTGTLTATAANATSYAQVANVCVVRTLTGCTVGATLVKSQASSSASGSSASSSDSGTQLVGVQVGTMTFSNTPAPNTVVSLGPLGYVVLNEQFCDTGSLASCSGSSHSGLTIRAIHVVLLPSASSQLVDVVVAEAHSDATAPR